MQLVHNLKVLHPSMHTRQDPQQSIVESSQLYIGGPSDTTTEDLDHMYTRGTLIHTSSSGEWVC
jgi:hypothetical protein